MIVSKGKKFQVQSESGKPLSKSNLSRGQAEKRLAQVEYFKSRDEGKKSSRHRVNPEYLKR